jgi:hypothetical protein
MSLFALEHRRVIIASGRLSGVGDVNASSMTALLEAIVLAGGSSLRFGGDKRLAQYRGAHGAYKRPTIDRCAGPRRCRGPRRHPSGGRHGAGGRDRRRVRLPWGHAKNPARPCAHPCKQVGRSCRSGAFPSGRARPPSAGFPRALRYSGPPYRGSRRGIGAGSAWRPSGEGGCGRRRDCFRRGSSGGP